MSVQHQTSINHDSTYRPYPTDTSIPLSLRPRSTLKRCEVSHVQVIQARKNCQYRRAILRIEVLESHLRSDIYRYNAGLPLNHVDTQSSHIADDHTVTKKTKEKKLWLQRAKELQNYFERFQAGEKGIEIKVDSDVQKESMTVLPGPCRQPSVGFGKRNRVKFGDESDNESDDEDQVPAKEVKPEMSGWMKLRVYVRSCTTQAMNLNKRKRDNIEVEEQKVTKKNKRETKSTIDQRTKALNYSPPSRSSCVVDVPENRMKGTNFTPSPTGSARMDSIPATEKVMFAAETVKIPGLFLVG
ncbi:hypothetical protein B0J11DRAFT_507036 [Dendryphion nanum]|uniref:Uncharacterized protein n=1 Tax=Dendryphion nanum TaxID=256645 RepID=A0A9P9DRJ2_9PLEO|nr:hypothetical protein B0J11DRAFT_507036 [Dendryphion nanum]